MKKILAAVLSSAMALTSVSAFAAEPWSYDGNTYESMGYTSDDPDGEFNLAVIANSDVHIYGDAMYIKGSVYSNGNIYVGDGQGNKIDGLFISGTESSVDESMDGNNLTWVCDGYIHVNDNGTRDGITYYSTKPEYAGAVKDGDTSFDCAYTPYEIPFIENVIEYANGNQWYPGLLMVSEDTHYKTLDVGGEGLIIDTTAGDVTIVIDKFNDTTNSAYIKVRGENTANIYINDYATRGTSTSSVTMTLLNERVDGTDIRKYSTNDNDVRGYIEKMGDPDKINLYINTSLNAVDFRNTNICANIYSNADSLTFSGGGKTLGNVSSGAFDFTITGGGTYVNGIVCVPDAGSRVVDSGTLYGQLHTDTLTINGAGRIIWQADSALAAASEPTPEPTIAPEPEPTEEPDIPGGDFIDPSSFQNAYIFGYEPVLDENGNVLWLVMEPEANTTVEEVAAMVTRIVDQVAADEIADNSYAEFVPACSGWAYKAMTYMSAKGAFNEGNMNGYKNITRGEAAKLIALGFNVPITENASNFTDVAGNKNEAYIASLEQYEYVLGDGTGYFRPDDNLSRVEFCAMFNHILGRTNTVYDWTTEIANYFTEEIGDGSTVVTPYYYGFTDADAWYAEDWYADTLLKATSAFTQGKVDVQLRKENIRNKLDDYDSQTNV